ncbi:MAG TPA: GNAT family N-acetyltransferase [archaeon]|nr:GNAT family N-acetyltransferase [archaeon]
MPAVVHDPTAQKFTIPLGQDKEALLAYTEVNQTWDCHTTIVPEEFRGQGLAEALATAAFQKARSLGMRILPSCPYLRERFLPRHPEFSDVVTQQVV